MRPRRPFPLADVDVDAAMSELAEEAVGLLRCA